MAKHELNVFLYGRPVGRLSGRGSLITGFKYRSDYPGPLLSHTMPVSKRNVGREVASSWFTGLLPEGAELRRAMAQAHGSRDTTSMGLLEQAGLDCAGAVQVTALPEPPQREQQLLPISDEEIGSRLIAANDGRPVADVGERWSVAGQQGKLALHQTSTGEWGRAIGGMPTTHIIKPGIAFVGRDIIKDQALTEHLTLAAARKLNIPTVESEFREFDGVPAVVVRRYDRLRVDGVVHRIHQEDLCQALGVGPEQKYEEDGGPGVAVVAQFLDRIAETPEQSLIFRVSFAKMVMYNYFSGSPDAHAKNYSVLILPDGSVSFAPLYDAASGFGYSLDGSDRLRFPRMAMRIGNRYRFGEVTGQDWENYARKLRLSIDLILSERNTIAQNLPDIVRDLLEGDIPSVARKRLLDSPLLRRIERVCKLTNPA